MPRKMLAVVDGAVVVVAAAEHNHKARPAKQMTHPVLRKF